MHRTGWVVVLCLALACLSNPAWADQGSRAAEWERQRAEKARELRPYTPGRLERALLLIENEDPLFKLAPHDGFFLRYGFTGRPVGAGMALGGGFRHDIFDRRARAVLEGGVSIRNYQLLRADFSIPTLAKDRVEIGVGAAYRHHPQEDFYGLGPASLQDDRTSFLVDHREAHVRGVLRPVRWFQAGTRVGVLNSSVGAGTDSRYPTVPDRFAATHIPALFEQPQYRFYELFGVVERRDSPGNAKDGGYYALSWRRHSDAASGRDGFDLVDAEVQQFFPIFDKKRVFALRAHFAAATPDEGGDVPFYLRPTLGGSNSLRGVGDYRFRDNVLFNANFEYRWEAFGALDMALFSDWGTVAPRVQDLSLGGLKRAYGIGFRFNTDKSVFLRADVGIGSGEGLKVFLKFSKAF